ncbi:MAG TPA: helix-hairpin-helix domain-containing protein [Myxococcota bacterium]
MICNTRSGRVLSLALLTAFGLALAGSSLAEDASPRLVGIVNINTATPEQLELLPGIGEARANAVVAMRKERGGFKSIEELAEVKGIGQAALERLRPFVSTEGKTTAQIK